MPVFFYMSKANKSLRQGRLLLIILLVVLYVWSGECVGLCGVNPVFYYNFFFFFNFFKQFFFLFLNVTKTCFYHFVFIYFFVIRRDIKVSCSNIKIP